MRENGQIGIGIEYFQMVHLEGILETFSMTSPQPKIQI
jgi:hypothetical protein